MALAAYHNREGVKGRTTVRILKSLPGHPKGALRQPHNAVLAKWLQIGIAEVVEETTHSTTLTLPKRRKRG